MSKQETTRRRRRRAPLAFLGLAVGVGAAFALVRWQRRTMPWTTMDREPSDFSLYEVSGDFTNEWPGGVNVIVGAHPVDLDSESDGFSTADTGLEY